MVNVNFRLSDEVKTEFDHNLKNMGQTLSVVLKRFIKKYNKDPQAAWYYLILEELIDD